MALLIERKADVNARDTYDLSPLHAAVRAGNLAIVNALIAAGADVNAAQGGGGETPLETARYNAASDEIVQALIAAGARE